MTDKEGYNYDKFLSDSSDDHPKLTEKQLEELLNAVREAGFPKKPIGDYKNIEKNFVIKQTDDDMNYQQAYSQTEIHIALDNVLGLAGERLGQFLNPNEVTNAKDSIQIVKDYFSHSGEAVINNSQIAKDNSD